MQREAPCDTALNKIVGRLPATNKHQFVLRDVTSLMWVGGILLKFSFFLKLLLNFLVLIFQKTILLENSRENAGILELVFFSFPF